MADVVCGAAELPMRAKQFQLGRVGDHALMDARHLGLKLADGVVELGGCRLKMYLISPFVRVTGTALFVYLIRWGCWSACRWLCTLCSACRAV